MTITVPKEATIPQYQFFRKTNQPKSNGCNTDSMYINSFSENPKKEIIMFTTYLVLSTFSNVKKVYLFASLFVEY